MASLDFGLRIWAKDSASAVLSGIKDKVGGFGASISNSLTGANDKLAKFGLVGTGIREATGLLNEFSKGFTDLDTASQAMKSLGADGERLAPILRNTAIAMSKDIPFAAAEIQGAMTDALASGIEPAEKDLSKFAETAAKLAAGSGTELGVVVKGLAGTLNAYGASASEATKYADIFFDVNNAGVTSIRELNAFMPALNASAAALGLSFADVGRGMALMTQKGASTADSSTAMKALLQEMAKPSNDFAKFMVKAGISMEQIQSGPLEKRLQAIRTGLDKLGVTVDSIFGSNEASTAIKVMTGDMKKMSEVFAQVNEQGSGSSTNAFKKMQDSVAVQTKQMETRIEAFKIQAIDSMGNLGIGFVSVTGQLSKMSGEITALASLHSLIPDGTFAALKNGASSAFSSLRGTASTAVSAVRGQMAGLSSALQGFSFSGVFASLRGGAASAMANMSGVLSSGITSLRAFAVQQAVAARGSALFSGGIATFAQSIGGGLVSGIKSVVSSVLSMNMAFLTSPVTWIALGIAGAAFLIYKNWEPIKAFFGGLFEGVKGFASGFMDGFSAAFRPIIDGFSAAFRPIIDAISSLFAPVQGVAIATGAAANNFAWLKDAGVIAGQYIGTAFRVVVTPILWVVKVLGQVIGMVTGLTNAGGNMAQFLIGAFTAITLPIQGVMILISGLFTFIQSLFSGASLMEAGSNMITSLWTGIQATWGKLVDGVKGLVSGITNLFSGKKEEAKTTAVLQKSIAKPPKPKVDTATTATVTQKKLEDDLKKKSVKAPKIEKPKIPKPDTPKFKPLNPPEAPDFSWIAKQDAEPPRIKPFPPIESPIMATSDGETKPIQTALPDVFAGATNIAKEVLGGKLKLPEIHLPSKIDIPQNLGDIKLPQDIDLNGFKLPQITLPTLPDIKLPDVGREAEKVFNEIKIPQLNLPNTEGLGNFEASLAELLRKAGIKTIEPIVANAPRIFDENTGNNTSVFSGLPKGSQSDKPVTVNFTVNLNINTPQESSQDYASDIVTQVQGALRRLAPELAREVQNAIEQDKRLEFAGF
jgi:TP901 family phage tail tape measure protein